MKILAVSDKIIPVIYSAAAREQFADISLVVGCGDLPYYYLEYILTVLDKPLFFVRGNHAHEVEYGASGPRRSPWGAVDLHRRAVTWRGLLLAGFEGARRYNRGPYQYTDLEMWAFVLGLVPHLLMNKLVHGRYLDILVTHAPPYQVGDADDPAHIGFRAFRWLLRWFKPRLMLHGHIHLYHPKTPWRNHFVETEIVNCYGYRVLELAEFGLARDPRAKERVDARPTTGTRLRPRGAQGVLEQDQELGDAPQQ